jgi:hypothetical protein
MGVGLVNRFIDHIQAVTTNNYYTIADFHTTNHSTLSLLNLLRKNSRQWILGSKQTVNFHNIRDRFIVAV